MLGSIACICDDLQGSILPIWDFRRKTRRSGWMSPMPSLWMWSTPTVGSFDTVPLVIHCRSDTLISSSTVVTFSRTAVLDRPSTCSILSVSRCYDFAGSLCVNWCFSHVFTASCSHMRALDYFIESISSQVGFKATRCDSWTHYQARTCTKNPSYLMGDPTKKW